MKHFQGFYRCWKEIPCACSSWLSPHRLTPPPPNQQITAACVSNITYIIRLPTNAAVLCWTHTNEKIRCRYRDATCAASSQLKRIPFLPSRFASYHFKHPPPFLGFILMVSLHFGGASKKKKEKKSTLGNVSEKPDNGTDTKHLWCSMLHT